MAIPRLFILSPTIIFQARVNAASFTYPIDTLTFDTVTTGAFGDIRIGMTLLLGTAAGLDDLGRTRIRGAATSTVLKVGRSSQGTRDGELNASDNMFITVLNEYRVWSKIPYIDSAGDIFKDSDQAFSDQTLDPLPQANMGPAVAATINSGTSVITVALDGTGSFATDEGATIASYAWDIADGTATVGTVTSSTLTVTFPAGFRYIALTVTDSNGKTFTTRRPIYARDPASDTTVDAFQIESHRITPMGQQLSLRIFSSLPETTYKDGTLVILFDGEPASASDKTNLMFVGWIHTDPARIDAQRTGLLKDITLQCLDVCGKLDTLPGFPQMIERAETPENWTQMANANVDRFLHYLIFWHSTAAEVADFTWSGTGNTYQFVRLAAEGESIYDQINRKCQSIAPDYRFNCNTLGQMMVKVDPLLQDTGSRTATVQVTLTGADYSDIRYTHQRPPRIRQLWGEAIQASTSVITPLFCVAPGTAPGQGEAEQRHSEQLAVNQTGLNSVTGHRYARLNARQGLFNITLAEGSDKGIEPANMTWVRLTITAAVAAQRGLAFTTERGLIQEINIRYSHERTGLVRSVELTWERESTGVAATTFTPAAADPVDDGDTWAPPPIAPAEVPEPMPETGVEAVAVISNRGVIWKTANFQTTPPTWSKSTSLEATFGSTDEIYSFVVDPFSPLYRGLGTTVRGFVATEDSVWRIDDIFGVSGGPSATLLYSFPTTGYVATWRSIAASFGRYQEDEDDNPWIIVASYYSIFPGADTEGVYTVNSVDAGATWGTEIEANPFDPEPFDTEGASRPRHRVGLWLSPRTPGKAYVAVFTDHDTGSDPDADTTVHVSDDWGDSWEALTGFPTDPIFLTWDSVAGHLHIPYPDNDAENIAYNGFYKYTETSPGVFEMEYGLARNGSEITPEDAGLLYGPRAALFGVRTFDSDRRYVVLAGFAHGGGSFSETDASNRAAVFVSDDYGDTFTLVDGPYTVGINAVYPIQAAFGADSQNTIFIWGNEGKVAYSEDFGGSFDDKSIATGGGAGAWGSSEQMVGFVGGE